MEEKRVRLLSFNSIGGAGGREAGEPEVAAQHVLIRSVRVADKAAVEDGGGADGGGCIAVLPQARRPFGPAAVGAAPILYRSLVRYPDGADTDMLCRDFQLSSLPTPGSANTVETE